MSFRPGSPLPRPSSRVVLARAAKLEATIQLNSARRDGRSKTFLTNIATTTPRRHSSASMASPRSVPRTNSHRSRRQSSMSSVSDIEAEYNKICGDDAMSVQSLPATLDYQYAKDDDDASIASTIVSYNDAGDWMYFDACPAEEASWQQQLMASPSDKSHSRPPMEIRAGRSSPVVYSPLSSPQRGASESFRRKKRVFETNKHANKQVKVDFAPLLVKAAFATGAAEDTLEYGCCGSSVGSNHSGASGSSLGEVLVDIYEQSRPSANRRGSDTTSTERSDSPTEYDPSTSTTAPVFTIIEEDEELSTSSSEATKRGRSVTRSPSFDLRASPSFFLSRFKRSTSLSAKDFDIHGSKDRGSSVEPRKKSLTKRGMTRSARLAGRRQDGEVLY